MAGPTQNNFNRDKKNNDQNNDPMGKEAMSETHAQKKWNICSYSSKQNLKFGGKKKL